MRSGWKPRAVASCSTVEPFEAIRSRSGKTGMASQPQLPADDSQRASSENEGGCSPSRAHELVGGEANRHVVREWHPRIERVVVTAHHHGNGALVTHANESRRVGQIASFE